MTARVAFVLALAVAGSAGAQTTNVAALKAAFIYNFVKLAEWPADALAPGQPLAICTLGDAAVTTALKQTVGGRVVEGHPLVVHVVQGDAPIRWCHLLYVGMLDAKAAALLNDAVKDASVFTVGDSDTFAGQGGVAQLMVENDRMRFAINVTAAARARLALSSRLLSLATLVKDNHDVKH
jgi:hypothetical protein